MGVLLENQLESMSKNKLQKIPFAHPQIRQAVSQSGNVSSRQRYLEHGACFTQLLRFPKAIWSSPAAAQLMKMHAVSRCTPEPAQRLLPAHRAGERQHRRDAGGWQELRNRHWVSPESPHQVSAKTRCLRACTRTSAP